MNIQNPLVLGLIGEVILLGFVIFMALYTTRKSSTRPSFGGRKSSAVAHNIKK